MISVRNIFYDNIAQTNEQSLALDIDYASGMHIYDRSGKKYLDLNSGISVSSLGHCHPAVVSAVKNQLDRYMHTMVYGEHIQSPQIEYAQALLPLLGENMQKIYFLMSGTEAVELSIKLARLFTGRVEILACKNAYHGSTAGSESLRSDLNFIKHLSPVVPGVKHIGFNNIADLDKISHQTAAVITELVQAEAGVISPKREFLNSLQKKCADCGCLLIFDEIQTGFYRTGSRFAHEKFGLKPDVLLIGKAMGGGMPIAATVSSSKIFSGIVKNPALAHITTFGGHPVSAAAARACLITLENEAFAEQVLEKEKLFHRLLRHDIIKEIRSEGLMMAVELTKRKYLKHVVNHTIQSGALIDYFLFNNRSFRLAPPLIITEEEIKHACDILIGAMNYAESQY